MRTRKGFRREHLDRGVRVRANDMFALSSLRELSYLFLPIGLFVALLVTAPVWGQLLGRNWITVIIITLSVGLTALSWDLLASVGLTSLGQALFFGLGGYSAGWLAHALDWGPTLTVPAATLIGALLATVMLMPVLRLRGIYFALITLALPLLLGRIIEATRILGGTEGMAGLPGMPSRTVTMSVLIVAFLVTLFAFRRLADSDYGVVISGIATNDRTVTASGLPVHWIKMQVVFIAALPAAFSGAVMTHHLRFVGLSVFGIENSVLPLTSVVVGGQGGFFGATLGAFLLIPLSEMLRDFGTLRIVLYSVVLVVWVVAVPGGLFGWLRRHYHETKHWVPVERSESS